MNAKIVFAMLSLVILLVACGPKEVLPEPKLPMQPMKKAPSVVETTEAKTPTATAVDIETTSSEVDQLEDDFDFSEFDMLEADLAEIDNLELE